MVMFLHVFLAGNVPIETEFIRSGLTSLFNMDSAKCVPALVASITLSDSYLLSGLFNLLYEFSLAL